MDVTESDLKKLIESVISKVKSEYGDGNWQVADSISLLHGVFSTLEEAVTASKTALAQLATLSIETRSEIIKKMREKSLVHAEELAELAVCETKLGRVEDKINKNKLAANKTPGIEDLVSESYTGDGGLTLRELAPLGVIGSITPTTNPAATIINNSISMVAAGNTVVFNPHPSAKKVSIKAIQLLNQAIVEAGGPENVLTSVSNPSLETSQELMSHPCVKALVVTGGSEVVKAAMSSGKKVIAAGPGNPPVVVDETANLPQAGKDIVLGASFDNNILCTAEKEVFVVDKVANRLKLEMVNNGAYELKGQQLKRLLDIILIEKNGKYFANRDFIGKNANVLLAQIGIKESDSIKLIITETPEDHPLVYTEMMMPILPIVRVSDIDEAISKAVKAEKGNRHTAMIHSQNITNLTKMAKSLQATILVKNGPSYAGLGMTGEGFTTLTIAGPTGEGLTSARTFTRQRRCVLVDGLRIV